MPHQDKLRLKFMRQKYGAKQRGIGFHLSFSQWLDIWEKSGKLDRRGTRRNQYVMARNGDKGPYKVGNVRICSSGQNSKEGVFHKMKKWQSPRKVNADAERLMHRMKLIRLSLGYTQAEMAVIFKVSRETYMRWERYGPPNTQAHRGYIRILLNELARKAKMRKANEQKREEKIRNARLALAADE